MDDLHASRSARLAALEARASRLAARRRAELPADSIEQAQAVVGDEVVDALDEAARAEIAELRRALARWDAGRFGRCEVCGCPIPDARLRALPSTTRCVAHARTT